jgi:hypothetical protein
MQNRKQAQGHAAKGSTKASGPGKQADKQQQAQMPHDADTDPSMSSESEFSQQGPGVGAEEPPRSSGKQQH